MGRLMEAVLDVQEAQTIEGFEQGLRELAQAKWDVMQAVKLSEWQRMFHRHVKKWSDGSIKQLIRSRGDELCLEFRMNDKGSLFVVPVGAWQAVLDELNEWQKQPGNDYSVGLENMEKQYFGGPLSRDF